MQKPNFRLTCLTCVRSRKEAACALVFATCRKGRMATASICTARSLWKASSSGLWTRTLLQKEQDSNHRTRSSRLAHTHTQTHTPAVDLLISYITDIWIHLWAETLSDQVDNLRSRVPVNVQTLAPSRFILRYLYSPSRQKSIDIRFTEPGNRLAIHLGCIPASHPPARICHYAVLYSRKLQIRHHGSQNVLSTVCFLAFCTTCPMFSVFSVGVLTNPWQEFPAQIILPQGFFMPYLLVFITTQLSYLL